jgi:hypothetical protein
VKIVVQQLFIADSWSAPMPTECTSDSFGFAPVEGREVCRFPLKRRMGTVIDGTVLNALDAPSRAKCRSRGDPLCDFGDLYVTEGTARTIECCIKLAQCSASKPSVERAWFHSGGIGGGLDRNAITDIGDSVKPHSAMREALFVSHRPQFISGLGQVVDPAAPPCAIGLMRFVRHCGDQEFLDLTLLFEMLLACNLSARAWRTQNRDRRSSTFRPIIEHPSQDLNTKKTPGFMSGRVPLPR